MPLVTKTSKFSNVYKQDTEPTGAQNGDIWMDTSTDSPTLSTSNGTEFKGIQVRIRNGSKIPIEALL